MPFRIRQIGKFILVGSFVIIIAGCSPLIKKSNTAQKTTNIILDEKPEILDLSATVIWDGEQTLGGIWISYPDVDNPERVLIKNISNGKSIVGAIFKQTKKSKTGSVLISSDAARALEIAQNEQTKVQIVAVRVPESTAPTNIIAENNIAKNADIEKNLSLPYIQVGIFGVQKNANKTKDRMLQLNVPVNIFDFQIKGKPYWRVVAGPANTPENRANMLNEIKSAGFTDAYLVGK